MPLPKEVGTFFVRQRVFMSRDNSHEQANHCSRSD
jgi:hypothetical protein